jgi:phosphoglycerate dehydrogenase-like enzyme
LSAPARVVVALRLAPELVEELSGHDLVFVEPPGTDNGALASALVGAQGLLVSSNVPVDGRLIAASPALRVISTMSAGLDHLDL